MKWKFWKVLPALMAVVLAAGAGKLEAKAAPVASGSSFEKATEIELDEEYVREKVLDEKFGYFKFTLPSSGSVVFTGLPNSTGYVTVRLADQNGGEIISLGFENSKERSYTVYLLAGDYYLYNTVNNWNNTTNVGTMRFSVSLASANETAEESQSANNNSIKKASALALDGGAVKGQLGNNDAADYYKFELTSSGKVSFDLGSSNKCLHAVLYDADGAELSDSKKDAGNGNKASLNISADLTKGSYYLALKADNDGYYGSYTITPQFTAVAESFQESGSGTNNTIATASAIVGGTNYVGQLALNDEVDYYKIRMAEGGTLKVSGVMKAAGVVVEIDDASGAKLVSKTFEGNALSNSFELTAQCAKGDNYIRIAKVANPANYYGETKVYTGNYEMTVEIPVDGITLDKESLDLKVKSEETITAVVAPSDATNPAIAWSSSDSNVAAVDENGKVTALMPGSVVITAAALDGSGVKASCTVTVAPDEQIVYRLYNDTNYEHLYTTDANEVRVLVASFGWVYEGSAWIAPTTGYPVYRLNNSGLQNHLYTTDENEVAVLTTQYGWELDNDGEPLFYSGGAQSIYRLYKEDLNGMHLLSTDLNEYNILGSPEQGWAQEGIKLNCLAIGNNQYPMP